jgi:hypothetical protein
MDSTRYATVVSYLASVVPVIASIVFTVLPITAIYLQKRAQREKQSLRLVEVRKHGADDLDVMWKYYQQAEEIMVFSGDFSWLAPEDSPMTKRLLTMGDRVTYVSSKTEADVAAKIGASLFAKLRPRFRFTNEVALKCSFVRVSGGSYFLYKSNVATGDEARPAVCVLSPTQESNVLLEALRAFCDHYRKSPTGP